MTSLCYEGLFISLICAAVWGTAMRFLACNTRVVADVVCVTAQRIQMHRKGGHPAHVVGSMAIKESLLKMNTK
ncbi:hypothetical protein V8C43DRAFT_298615 [Trichoderma afarasin]